MTILRRKKSRLALIAAVPLLFLTGALLPETPAPAKKEQREDGEFLILSAGRQIGTERFTLVLSEDTATSTSALSFRNPANVQQRIHIETRLEMNGRFTPLSYELKSDVDGQKGVILGKFSPNQAIFEYGSPEPSTRHGLLVGDQYTVLDTNVFHHFIFLARLFLDGDTKKSRRLEVVIPQENEGGFLRITELDQETIPVRGKNAKCRRLRADSGSLLIDLWVDDQRTLQKIAVPAREIVVVRND